MVFGNEDKHVDAIIAQATESQLTVPVLVVARNREFATKIFERLHKANEASQLFINDKEGNARLFVHSATRRYRDGRWRITVCDYFGGRGHDYRSSLDADEHGGFMVIVTTIPDSLREWVQWKGRTARQDSPGQYGVLLCSDDPNVKKATDEHQINLISAGTKSTVDEGSMKHAMDFEAEETLDNVSRLSLQTSIQIPCSYPLFLSATSCFLLLDSIMYLLSIVLTKASRMGTEASVDGTVLPAREPARNPNIGLIQDSFCVD
jgi:superfamily II DNA/RNA helicase